MDKSIRARFWLMVSLVAGVALMRILPHPWNFAPVTAMALFGGAHFERKAWAFAVPLAAMALSDAALQALYLMGLHPNWGWHDQLPVVYLSFAAVVALGFLLRGRRTPLPVAGAALSASVLFFLASNFGVWVTGVLGYPMTWEGLVACYVAAIPFFGSTLAGDLSYTALLFGAFALAERRVPLFAAPQAA